MGIANSIVLLTVDSLRWDRTTHDCLGKSLEVFNEDYVEFTNAFSYGVATPFAFPGIIAGAHPVGNGNIPDGFSTIAEGIDGNATAYANNAHLREERGYAEGFTQYQESPSIDGKGNISFIDKVARRLQKIEFFRESNIAKHIYNQYLRDPLPISSVPADGMAKLVRDKLDDQSEEFIWGHWMDPHLPYHPDTAVNPPKDIPSLEQLEDIRNRISDADADELSPEEIELSRDLYDANVRYYDKHFSKLLRWMQDQPWYDDALVIVASDHGEYFGEHSQLFHTWDIDPYDEAVHVPLWVKYPNYEDAGKNLEHVVGTGDILATISNAFDNYTLEGPAYTAPLRQVGGRHVVSVSNTVKRLTEADGSYFLRRDESVTENGTVSDEGKKFINEIRFPECKSSTGEALGVEESERRRRLKNLGYR